MIARDGRRPSNLVYGAKVLVWVVMTFIGLCGSVLAPWGPSIPFQILLALAMVHGVELCHQALHNTGFTGREANRWAGAILGLPMLVSFRDYQIKHLHHHNCVGTPDDTEFWVPAGGRSTMRATLEWLFLLGHYKNLLFQMWRALNILSKEHRLVDRGVRQDHVLICGFLLGVLALAVIFGLPAVAKAYILPLVFLAGPLHAIIELPEHYGCSKGSPDVFENTRSIKAGRFVTWFVNGNNFHVEHHRSAFLPVEALAEEYRSLAGRHQYNDESYWEFYSRVWRGAPS